MRICLSPSHTSQKRGIRLATVDFPPPEGPTSGCDEFLFYRDLIAAGDRKEIYTYMPKGDLICLPVNSIALDFAFCIHSLYPILSYLLSNRRVPKLLG